MQGPQYIFAIENEAGQSASYENNTLIWNSTPTPLDFSPDAWQTMTVLVERNKANFGMDISYGVPENFVKTAAGILKSMAYLKGIEFVCYLRCFQQLLYFNDTEYGFYYDQLFKIEIDLSSFVDTGQVQANMLQGGVSKYLKANQNITYSIDLDVPERKPILMDGITLLENASFLIQDPFDIDFTGGGNHIMGLEMINNEQKTTLGAQTSVRKSIDTNPAIFASQDFCLETGVTVTTLTVTVDTAVTVQPFPGSSLPILPTLRYTMSLRIFDAAGNLITYPGNDNLLYDTGPEFESAYGRHVIKVTKTLTVPANAFVYPFSQVNTTNTTYANGIQFLYDNDSLASSVTPNFLLQYNFKYKPTICYGLLASQLWTKLIEKMTDGKFTGKSDLLDSPDLNLLFTCGDALRQLLGSQIKISMGKLFSCLNLIFGIGQGDIGGNLRLEKKKFWVTPASGEPTDLGESGTFKVYPYTDCLFSSIKFGWPNQNYNVNLGDVNGKYEICVTQIMNSPTTRVSTVLDLTTEVRADMYGAEFDRINLDGKTSIADNADNDTFVFHVKKDITTFNSPITGSPFFTAYEFDRSINQYILDNNIYVEAGQSYVVAGVPYVAQTSQYLQVGVLDKATAFNVALSPKQCLLRAHGDYLHSCLEFMDDQYLTFASSDKNSSLIINNPLGYSTEENGNVQIATLDARIFQPWIFEGMIDNPPNLSALLITDPVRTYQTSYAGARISGTSLKSSTAPTDNATQAYQILLDPTVDKTPFINIYE